MRLYARLMLTRGCEAPGCSGRSCSYYPRGGGLVRACSPLCAAAADVALTELEARTIEAEQHLVEGEAVELE